jgi:hypothetical protein
MRNAKFGRKFIKGKSSTHPNSENSRSNRHALKHIDHALEHTRERHMRLDAEKAPPDKLISMSFLVLCLFSKSALKVAIGRSIESGESNYYSSQNSEPLQNLT